MSVAELVVWNEWEDRAACLGVDSDLFFPERGQNGDMAKAKQVCRGYHDEITGQTIPACPVRLECLSEALDRGEKQGVWGGLSERERRGKLRTRWRTEGDGVLVERFNREKPLVKRTAGVPLATNGHNQYTRAVYAIEPVFSRPLPIVEQHESRDWATILEPWVERPGVWGRLLTDTLAEASVYHIAQMLKAEADGRAYRRQRPVLVEGNWEFKTRRQNGTRELLARYTEAA